MEGKEERAYWAHLEASRVEERKALVSILEHNLKEQKRARWSKNGFRIFIALYLVVFLWFVRADAWREVGFQDFAAGEKHVAVVDIRGPIMAATTYSADHIIKGLRRAFGHAGTVGVIVRINSPGGSPVQAGRVYDEVMRLRRRHPDTPVYAALEDLCASGGYYIAASFPTIYADKASLVGSIGVILQGFGLQEMLDKLGVESRLLTSGKNKAFLNPFGPLDPDEKAHAQQLLRNIHTQFVQAVRQGRGDRLKTSMTELFEGLVWTGEEAVTLGLVDGLGSADWIAREKLQQTTLKNFTYEQDWLSRMGKEVGIGLAMAFGPSLY